jgi:hypothetical protein
MEHDFHEPMISVTTRKSPLLRWSRRSNRRATHLHRA